jgi:protease-4
MNDTTTSAVRALVVLAAVAGTAAAGYLLFVVVPGGSLAVLLGVLLTVVVAVAGARVGGRVADAIAPGYDVAEVAVDDVITRDGGAGPVPGAGLGVPADDVVEQIERADDDDAAEALVVRLNTPGGEVVPSEDIRQAAADFDGPTVAYAVDQATSGGYWIASGCDEFHARRGSVVGSIGVNGAQLGRVRLAEKLGLDYRRFVAGEYKDTPSPWRPIRDEEIEYFQGLLDGYYEQFVETVVEGREMDETTVRDTEARVYLGEEAEERGLVDAVGPREDMEERLAERLDRETVAVREFEPEQALGERLSMGARSVALSFGAGLARVLVGDDDGPDVRV